MQLNIHKVRHEVFAMRYISCESVLHKAWGSWGVKREYYNIYYLIWVLICLYDVFIIKL